MIAVLGAGPHGHQLAALVPHSDLYDDLLPGFDPCLDGARRHPWIVGAAWPQVRKTIAEVIEATDQHYVCEPYHGGLIVFPGAKIGSGVELGQHVHVEFNAIVSHGCVIGDYTTICPGAVLAGEVTLEPEVFIGANATVIHGGITIGRGAIVGAGAVVIDNVPAGATVAGVPAVKL